MSTTKLWISDKLELRHSPAGWPDFDVYMSNPYMSIGEAEGCRRDYQKALTKAKEESISFEDQTEVILRYQQTTGFIMPIKPDTFIEIKGEVEVVEQFKRRDGKLVELTGIIKVYDELIHQVARLKPVNSATESDPGVGQYYEKAHGDGKLESAEIKWEPDSIFTREDVREMKERINELEQDNSEGFEKYQELLIQNRNLKERVKELEDFIADLYENVDPHEMQSKLHDFLTE